MKDKTLQIDSSGNNSGIIVGENTGTIQVFKKDIRRIPSLISDIIPAMGMKCLEFDESADLYDLQEYKPDDKITYNCVIRYKYIIEEYAAYYTCCDDLLNIYDDSNIRGKNKILKCIHLWYLEAKGEILKRKTSSANNDIDVIREYSDEIIEKVKQRIFETVKNSDKITDVCMEDLNLGIACFTCYCFMECKILERPE